MREFKCMAGSEPIAGVTHEMPMCERYERLEPDEFMVAVNVAVATRRGVGLA
jgi:hypothetical protein